MEPKLINYTHDIVVKKMSEIIEKLPDICECAACSVDRIAFVLNELPPKYIVTDEGQLYAKLQFTDSQQETDITSTIIRAVELVKLRPRH